jgi:hypothetical protein
MDSHVLDSIRHILSIETYIEIEIICKAEIKLTIFIKISKKKLFGVNSLF